jgi:hypothetical protein
MIYMMDQVKFLSLQIGLPEEVVVGVTVGIEIKEVLGHRLLLKWGTISHSLLWS